MKENRKIYFLYSGQGSQYYGMAASLYNQKGIFREYMLYFDEIVFNEIGVSIIGILYENHHISGQPFDRLLYSHPAIFAVEYALSMYLHLLGIDPDGTLGSSLGEAVALSVSGVVPPDEIIRFLARQAKIFEEVCPNGGMLTVLDNRSVYPADYILGDTIETVSVDNEHHFVLSGNENDISSMAASLSNKKITCIQLPVRYGFHSKQIDAAQKPFMDILRSISINRPRLHVYSSESGSIQNNFTPDMLWRVVRGKICFREALLSIPDIESAVLVDISPSGSLAGITRQILGRRERIYSIITPFSNENRNIELLLEDIKHRI